MTEGPDSSPTVLDVSFHPAQRSLVYLRGCGRRRAQRMVGWDSLESRIVSAIEVFRSRP